jgi:hypothetical protein
VRSAQDDEVNQGEYLDCVLHEIFGLTLRKTWTELALTKGWLLFCGYFSRRSEGIQIASRIPSH